MARKKLLLARNNWSMSKLYICNQWPGI